MWYLLHLVKLYFFFIFFPLFSTNSFDHRYGHEAEKIQYAIFCLVSTLVYCVGYNFDAWICNQSSVLRYVKWLWVMIKSFIPLDNYTWEVFSKLSLTLYLDIFRTFSQYQKECQLTWLTRETQEVLLQTNLLQSSR